MRDARAQRRYLVLIGQERLRSVGIDVPSRTIADPDHRLYELLACGDSDSAYSRYNALIRRLVSFACQAAGCAVECAQ
ncbi:MAG TPA: hypothetical protein VIO12_10805, partial [Thermoanaerobaculia bacterium]